jgi:hypothetical protein
MTAIWSTDAAGGWKLLSNVGVPDEATLHSLVEQAPQLLPLSGTSRLAVVGREVRLGAGSADLLAIEPSGRVAIIEVKLAANAEARRAVVAQVLAYAAYLHGLTISQLETEVLARHLSARGYATLFDAALGAGEERASEASRRRFDEGLTESLAEGRFRLVIVLDSAPTELVQLVGYLEYVTDRLVIDLVTVASYRVGETEMVVPTLVEPEPFQGARSLGAASSGEMASDTPGIGDFRAAVLEASDNKRDFLAPLCDWATQLQGRGLTTPTTYRSSSGTFLRVYVPGDMSLVTLNCGLTTASLQLFRSVFERRAPRSLVKIEELIGSPIGQGTAVRSISEGLLNALTAAYEEAIAGKLVT